MTKDQGNPLRDAINSLDEQLEQMRPVAEKYLQLGELRNSLAHFLNDPDYPVLDPIAEVEPPTVTHTRTVAADSPIHQPGRKLPAGDEIEYVRRGPVTRKIIRFIKENPGLSVREIADKVGTSTPYAFDVIRNLHHNGAVDRQEGRVYPVGEVKDMVTAKSAPRPKAKAKKAA